MDANNFSLRNQPDGEIKPIVSRVSAISINNEFGDRHLNPLPDCEGHNRNQNHIDVEDKIGFEDRKMAKHEECCSSSQYPTEDNDKNVDDVDKAVVCDTKLPQHENSAIYDQSGLLREHTAKTEDINTITSQSTGLDNYESNLVNPEVCKTQSFHCKTENKNQNRCISFTSQYMDPMIDAEDRDTQQTESKAVQHKGEKYFYYEPPLCEETGVWIPVSIPPMSESEHEEWSRGFSSNGGIFPDGDNRWSQFLGEDKELTMWDVFIEMLLVARGKVSSFASTDVRKVSWISSHLVEQAWREMAQTLTEANYGNTQEILEAEPPKWLPDSAASSCMLCSVRFHPIMCTRHHCRFCGGIFCNDCSKGRRLLPARFRAENPQRVCDVCCVRLESVQTYLMDQVSRAAQLPTHDLTDLSTLRSWLNFPWGQSLEYEIYKCTNTIRGYNKVGSLRPEKSIPDIILRQAKGLAILTVMKVGMMVTYNIGTGLVVARREDGSWSPPSAISSFGVGWGAQGGGELMDLIIVLRSKEAVKTFSSDVHLSVGAGLSAAVGIVGRTAEADLRAGAGGYAACYTYSCTKGAFIGCSLEGSVVTTRTQENSRFYGSQSLNASDIILGSLPRPPAAAILYRALADLYQKH